MDNIITAGELRTLLEDFPPETKVMIPVVKYPGEFGIEWDAHTDEWRWDLGSDVEVVPLEAEDILHKDGQCWLVIELTDYSEERAQLNGSGAGPNG